MEGDQGVSYEFKTYPDREMLAMDLANQIAGELRAALSHQDRAALAVPGGTSPGPVFDVLCAADLDWDRVDVLLTDERWVPESSERYVGSAFALSVEGADLRGNASLEKHQGGELQWRLVTNETWPTRVEPFIRRGRPRGGEIHIRELASLAREREVAVPEGVMEEIFRAIDARLFRLFRVLRAR